MGIGWVHRPRPAPHLHGCMTTGAAHREAGFMWVCPVCETLWVLHDPTRLVSWKHWELATWWQRWKYWNWQKETT